MTKYHTTLDRAGWALALGGACTGSAAASIGWASETGDPARLAGLWLGGAVAGMLIIAGLGGPIWWFTQRNGRRGPIAAGLTGTLVAGVMTLGVLTQGYGAGLPVADAATLTATWTSAVATAVVAGFLGGLMALAMWLVSYRPV
jgi:hypothetical protein